MYEWYYPYHHILTTEINILKRRKIEAYKKYHILVLDWMKYSDLKSLSVSWLINAIKTIIRGNTLLLMLSDKHP